LSTAASAVDDAARRQTELSAELAAAWSGSAASAAQDFLAHQNAAAAAVRDGLTTAATALATLRDDLWQAVDVKVNAALDIDGRPSGQRGEWLAAAHTVTTGAGDVAAASELVDQQVKPFVDNDISAEWVSEMRAGFDRVAAAFDTAIARLEACPAASFDVSGETGEMGPPERPATSTMPAAAPAPAPAAAPTEPAAPPAGAAPAVGAPSLGGGMPSLGGGLSGFGQQLADLIGGLSGAADALPDVEDLTQPDEVFAEDEPEDEESQEDEPAADDEEPDAEDGNSGEEPADTEPEQLEEPVPEPMSVPEPVAPPPAPPTVMEPEVPAAERPPCEIAAEELPRVGE
jgi:hypothetical protein